MFALYGVALFCFDTEINREMITSFGADLRAAWLASIFYWIGTTRGGQNKDEVIANSMPVQRSSDDTNS
jgi:hypothetical protein